MIPEYKYQVKDYSIITSPFKEFIVAPLIKFVPWRIPANIITILSNFCMYGALVVALYSRLDQRINYLLAALLIFMYAVGDHIDGMQAKRTKTSSALGEFFDHYLDAFNTGVMLMTTFVLYGITSPVLVGSLLLINYLAHASVFYEQFKTKWLIFEKIGSLEAVLITSGLLLLSCIDPINDFLLYRPFFGLKVIELIFIASAFGTIITFIKTLKRAKIVQFNFYLFCGLLILITILGLFYIPNINLPWVITLYGASYIGNLMQGHLADGKERKPDYIVPAIMLINLFSNVYFGYSLLGYTLIYALLLLYTITIAIKTIYTLRHFWVWSNPINK
jgi:ethanolaminephosphotransferase